MRKTKKCPNCGFGMARRKVGVNEYTGYKDEVDS
jgi:hypothetical protein